MNAIEKFGKKTKIIEDINALEENYGALLKKSLALGRLSTKISQQSEAVGLLMPNVTNTIALIFGMSAFKRIPALLNYTSGSAGIQQACQIAKIKTIISSRKFIQTAKLEAVIEKLENINIVYLEDLQHQFNLFDRIWLVGFALLFPRKAIIPSQPEEAAIILFTSRL